MKNKKHQRNQREIHSVFSAVLLSMAAWLGLNLSPASARPVVPISKPAPQDRIKFDTTRFMPESEIKYGQTGYALTVFHGQKIERFSVKMLGVLTKVNTGKDLILFRVTSGPSLTRSAMIVAGMSGSPVYVGNRMVGAIAYGLPFAREPMGLITPIKDMLDSWDPDLPAKPGLSPAAESQGLSPASGVTVDSSQLAPLAAGFSGTGIDLAHGPLTFEPMMTPISVSGVAPQILARLSTQLAPYRLMPVAGGGASGPQNLSPAQQRSAAKGFTPGAAVGVSLAQGDIDMTAIGTLTYRDGDKIVAFGHPFTGIGPIDAALTTASITDIFPSYLESTKLGMPVSTVGRVFQDRPFSVGGAIGSMPQMIPVDVNVDDEADKRQTSFHAKIINHPLLTGQLALIAVNEAILEAHGTPGDAVAYVTTDVDADQVGHILRRNVFFDPQSIDATALGDLNNIISLLTANPFYQLGVHSVKVQVRIQDRHATAQIDHIVVPRTTYQPGDTVDVGVVLRPYKKPQQLKTVSLTIPANAPDGNVILTVRGGAIGGDPVVSVDASGAISVRSAGDIGQPPPATVQQMVKQYLEQPRNNDLVASLSLPSAAPEIGGEKLSVLPPNMAMIMRTQHASALKLARDEIKTIASMPWVVTGTQQIALTILKKEDYDLSTVSDSGLGSPGSPSGGSPSTIITGPGASTASIDDSGSIQSAATDPDLSFGATSAKMPLQATPAPANPGGGDASPGAPAPSEGDSAASQSSAPVPTVTVSVGSADTSAADSQSDAAVASVISAGSKLGPVVRVASIWRENTEPVFDGGTLDGVAVTSAPDIRLAPAIKKIAGTSAAYVWSQAYDTHGDLFIGTGDDGLIYKLAPGSSQPALFAHTGQLEVTALAYNQATGDLYAATAPHGILFRIGADGKVAKLLALDDHYIPALLLGKDQKTLYLTTGGGAGKIYGVDLSTVAASAKPRLIFSSPDVHLLCLAQDSAGMLYTGGNPNGVVYRIDPSESGGKGRVVYDSPCATVSSVAIDDHNRLYIGTAGPGSIFRVDLDKLTDSSAPQIAKVEVARAGDIVTSLAVAGSQVWAASGDTLFEISPAMLDGDKDTISSFPSDPEVTYITATATPGGSGITAGTASIAAVYGFAPSPDGGKGVAGSYVSPIHDARLKSKWGAISWIASVPKGASVALQTRTGDVPKPDATWSDWTGATPDGSAARIVSPPARFIQYRALLTGAEPNLASTPKLSSVSVYYLPENRPPSVRILSPSGGDAVSGKLNLRWFGSDPDRDTLEYEIYTSSDDGQTWNQLDTGGTLRQRSVPASSAPASASPSPSATSSGATTAASPSARRMADELAKHPEIPAAVRQKMLHDAEAGSSASPAASGSSTSAAAASAASATSSATVLPPQLRAQTFTWDTKSMRDGNYRIKVVASDAPSNADGALTDESVSDPITVVNTAPTIALDSAHPAVAPDGSITVTGTVKSTLVFVKAVQYKLDDDGWMAASPVDGMFDSNTDQFQFTAKPDSPGPHHIVIEVFDRAGNTATQTVDVK